MNGNGHASKEGAVQARPQGKQPFWAGIGDQTKKSDKSAERLNRTKRTERASRSKEGNGDEVRKERKSGEGNAASRREKKGGASKTDNVSATGKSHKTSNTGGSGNASTIRKNDKTSKVDKTYWADITNGDSGTKHSFSDYVKASGNKGTDTVAEASGRVKQAFGQKGNKHSTKASGEKGWQRKSDSNDNSKDNIRSDSNSKDNKKSKDKSNNNNKSYDNNNYKSNDKSNNNSKNYDNNKYNSKDRSNKEAVAVGLQKRRTSGSTTSVSAEDIVAGDRLVVTIKRIGINGEGVGYYKRKAVFVEGALPDEVAKVEVTSVEAGRLIARLIELEKKAETRVQPPCPVYDSCGGCQLQHMSYAGQLAAKEEIVREAFARYAGIDRAALPLRPIEGMSEPWGYRNKAQLQAGAAANGQLALGLYEPGSHRLVDITGCAVQHPGINAAAAAVKAAVVRLGVPVLSGHAGQDRREGKAPGGSAGRLRSVVLRIDPEGGALQLTLVATAEQFAGRDELVAAVREEVPSIHGIFVNVNASKTPQIFGDHTVLQYGEPALMTKLEQLQFELSPRAFFQLNSSQTVKLYDYVREAAALTGKERVVDAYCGTGTIGLWLAQDAKEVRGMEIIPEAIVDARQNAERNGFTNTSYHVGRAEELLPKWLKQGFEPDVIVVDPPRTGCDRALLQAMLQAKPQRIVYVSCNPSTLAKDTKELLAGGYRLEWVRPTDMFPMTSHVECCMLLVRE